LYSQKGDITYADIFKMLERLITSNFCIGLPGKRGNKLLGGHGRTHQYGSMDSIFSVDIRKAIEEVVGKWPALDPLNGRDMGGRTVGMMLLGLRPVPKASTIIKKAILNVAKRGVGNVTCWEESKQSILFPFPTGPDRRAAVLSALGRHPLYFRGECTRMGKTLMERVHIYLDVSGSMELELLKTIFGSLKPLKHLLHHRIHAFSTEISDHTSQEILNGKYSTTGGTDINCIADHVINNDVKRGVIITDGYVGQMEERFKGKLKANVRMSKILTCQSDPEEIDQFKGKTYLLPPDMAREA